MIVLESNNPEESKIGWFAYVPKNRVNSENWKLVCEQLNNLEISLENTLYLPSTFLRNQDDCTIDLTELSVAMGSRFF